MLKIQSDSIFAEKFFCFAISCANVFFFILKDIYFFIFFNILLILYHYFYINVIFVSILLRSYFVYLKNVAFNFCSYARNNKVNLVSSKTTIDRIHSINRQGV